MAEQTLAQRMRAHADMLNRAGTQPDTAMRLNQTARELEEATTGFWAEIQTHTAREFVGSWARARLLWREVTGEPLI